MVRLLIQRSILVLLTVACLLNSKSASAQVGGNPNLVSGFPYPVQIYLELIRMHLGRIEEAIHTLDGISSTGTPVPVGILYETLDRNNSYQRQYILTWIRNVTTNSDGSPKYAAQRVNGIALDGLVLRSLDIARSSFLDVLESWKNAPPQARVLGNAAGQGPRYDQIGANPNAQISYQFSRNGYGDFQREFSQKFILAEQNYDNLVGVLGTYLTTLNNVFLVTGRLKTTVPGFLVEKLALIKLHISGVIQAFHTVENNALVLQNIYWGIDPQTGREITPSTICFECTYGAMFNGEQVFNFAQPQLIAPQNNFTFASPQSGVLVPENFNNFKSDHDRGFRTLYDLAGWAAFVGYHINDPKMGAIIDPNDARVRGTQQRPVVFERGTVLPPAAPDNYAAPQAGFSGGPANDTVGPAPSVSSPAAGPLVTPNAPAPGGPVVGPTAPAPGGDAPNRRADPFGPGN
jgi:hypothetical protein